MKRVILLFSALMLCISVAFGQETTVSGVVIDGATNEPMWMVNVQVEGNTSVGTLTDENGAFTLKVSGKKNLVFSMMGYQTQTLPASNGMRVVMMEEATEIEEVVAVAYGTQSKKSIVGSNTVVKGETLEKKNPSDVTKALAGEIAGVQVVSSTGQPGTTASVRIRGIGSVNSSTTPLYVVDGIPFDGDISGIDPSDVASTTVLKDATATSLYGARGANGVILITTKKGTSGETGTIDVDVKYGGNLRLIPMYETITDAQRYVELCWEGIYNQAGGNAKQANLRLFNVGAGGLPAAYNRWDVAGNLLIDGNGDYASNPNFGKFYDHVNLKQGYIDDPDMGWKKAIFRNGNKIEANLKIHGGSGKTTYYTSFGYLKDEGYYIGSDYDRFTARVNVDHQAKKWLKGNLNMSYSYSRQNSPGQSSNMNNGFAYVNECPAIYPVFLRDENGYRVYDNKIVNPDGSHPYAYDYGDVDQNGNIIGRTYGNGINPAGALQYDKDRTERHQLAANAMLEVTFYEGLKLQSNFGIQYVGSANSDLTNAYYGDAAGVGRITKTQNNYMSFTWNQILSYMTTVNRVHNIDAFVAHETGYMSSEILSASQNYTARPEGLELSNAIEMSGIASYTNKATIESYFAQFRYNYNEKYFFHGTLRGDGSSRFAKGHRWGVFGAIGLGWLMSSEDFMQNQDVIKNLKFKASWGVLGNQDIGLFLYTNQYSINNVDGEIGYTLDYIGNKDLTWEKSSIWNVGFELGIKNILDLEAEYFYKTTNDMLFPRSVAPSLGYSYYYVNEGGLVNQGVEFQANIHAVQTKGVNFDIRLNGAYYDNKITKMPTDNNGKEMNMSGGTSLGHSLYDYYTVEYLGVDGATGKALYASYYNPADLTTGFYTEHYDYISSVHNYILEHWVTDEAIYNENIAKGQFCVLVDKATQKRYLNNPDLILEKKATTNYQYASSTYVGKSAIPKLQGGIGFDLAAKGFEFSASFQYSLGGWGGDSAYELLMHSDRAGEKNWHVDIENRWTEQIGQNWNNMTPEEQSKIVPRLSNGADNYANSGSTRFLISSSYLTLSNVRIGYSFPKKLMDKAKIKKLSVYVSGDNLFCLSARKGYIPMASFSGGSDTYSYSPLSTIMGGIKISF